MVRGFDRATFKVAQRELSGLVRKLAEERARELGFGWLGTEAAPSTYRALVEAHERSVITKQPLAISSMFCDRVIYMKPADNVAMRFWHDTAHVGNRLTFKPDDELELGLWHLEQLREVGVAKRSLLYRMVEVDLLGQNYLQAVAGRFPVDQTRFVRQCLKFGLHEGVLLEIRHGEGSSAA